MSQTNPVHAMSFCFFEIHFNITLAPTPRSPKWLDAGQNLEDDPDVVSSTLSPATTPRDSQVAGGGGGHRVWVLSAKYRMKSS